MTEKLRSLEPPPFPSSLPPFAEQAASTSGAARASASRRLGAAIVRTSESSRKRTRDAAFPRRIMPGSVPRRGMDPPEWSNSTKEGPGRGPRLDGVDVLSQGHEKVVFCSDSESV